MGLIKREKTDVLKRVTLRMEANLLNRLGQYAEYLESSKDHIISEAIRYIIDRDKEFPGNQNLPQIPPQNPPQNLPQLMPQIPPQNVHQKAASK